MDYFDPHIHMVSRTTDDYENLARMGCVGVSEPAFWAGFDRGSAESFRDYFRQLTEFEPQRAAQYRIQHYSWLCINAKEAENVTLSREVLRLIPEFLGRPGVLGIGEIGLNKNTPNEATIFLEHLELARNHSPIGIGSHAAPGGQVSGNPDDSRYAGGREPTAPHRVLVDHVEEHTSGRCGRTDYWAGMTLYPVTKCTPARAADLVEIYGPERLLVNSAGDWGPSSPSVVPDFILEMRRRGHSDCLIRKIVYDNPREFFGQSDAFDFVPPAETRAPSGFDREQA